MLKRIYLENELGLEEERFIPQAYYSKNEALEKNEDRFKLYYFILGLINYKF